MRTITNKMDKITDFLNSTNYCEDVDLVYYLNNLEDIDSADELREEIEEQGGFDIEIIYYSAAIEYLSSNDPSLSTSMGIADEMGFNPKDITSETLASLLASQIARDEWYDIESDLNDLIEELNDMEE